MESLLDPKIDLDEVWKGFVSEYCSITGQILPLNASAKQLKAGLDLALGGGASHSGDRARAVTTRLTTCLQRFGDVVVGSASTIFGPSTQCWSAISAIFRLSKNTKRSSMALLP